jgi:hypothetical protein
MDPSDLRLNAAQAAAEPCAGCAAGCCNFLPLRDFKMLRFSDLDYARYLLNFDRMELALLPDGTWWAYYRVPCRQFDVDALRCRVHGTEAQPEVCQRHSPYDCFYRRTFHSLAGGGALRMDRGRLEFYAAHLLFDGQRDVVAAPLFEALRGALPALEPVPQAPPVPPRALTAAPTRSTWADFDAPCKDCPAWCCTRLNFPRPAPNSVGSLDHLLFSLGYPGVEVGVTGAGEWSLVVRTTCRHHTEAGCGIFGAPERPSVCTLYDATRCGYRARFRDPPGEAIVHFEFEQFGAVADLFSFDDDGQVTAAPAFEVWKDSVS